MSTTLYDRATWNAQHPGSQRGPGWLLVTRAGNGAGRGTRLELTGGCPSADLAVITDPQEARELARALLTWAGDVPEDPVSVLVQVIRSARQLRADVEALRPAWEASGRQLELAAHQLGDPSARATVAALRRGWELGRALAQLDSFEPGGDQ